MAIIKSSSKQTEKVLKMTNQITFNYNDVKRTAYSSIKEAINVAKEEFLAKHDADDLRDYFSNKVNSPDRIDVFMIVVSIDGSLYYNANTDEQGVHAIAAKGAGEFEGIAESIYCLTSENALPNFYDQEHLIAINKEGEAMSINNLEIEETIIDTENGFLDVVF